MDHTSEHGRCNGVINAGVHGCKHLRLGQLDFSVRDVDWLGFTGLTPREWVEQNYGLPGRLRDAGESTELLVKVLALMPRVLEQGETAAQAFAQMAQNGLRLDDETIRKLAAEEAGYGRASRAALWVGAVALVMMAFAIWVWGS